MVEKTRNTFCSEKYNSILAQRLRELIKDTTSLKEFLGCSVQAVNQYKTGQSLPKVENLIKIAEYYDVSVDYLIGVTNTPNRDTTTQAVCEYTGLSPENIDFLHRVNGAFFSRTVDFLIDDARIDDGDENTILKLIRFFMDYDDNNHPNRRIDTKGNILNSTKKRTDSIAMDASIIDNAVLEQIKQRLLNLKGRCENGKL